MYISMNFHIQPIQKMPVGWEESQLMDPEFRFKQVQRDIYMGKTENALVVLSDMDLKGDDVDVRIFNAHDRTLLMEALMNMNEFGIGMANREKYGKGVDYRIVLKLLQMRASTLMKDAYGENAFHHALRNADYTTIFTMVWESRDTSKNCVKYAHPPGGMFEHRDDGYTPLHIGLQYHRKWGDMKCILDSLCDTTQVLNYATCKGHTVLHFAVMYDNGRAVSEILRRESTDNDIHDHSGRTPFDMTSGKPVMRKIFLDFRYTGDRKESAVFKHGFNGPSEGVMEYSHEEPSSVCYTQRHELHRGYKMQRGDDCLHQDGHDMTWDAINTESRDAFSDEPVRDSRYSSDEDSLDD